MDQIFSNISLLFEFPVVNISILLEGLMIGSLFALSAYGLALVWGVMNVKNLAQGDFVVAGGYVSWYFSQLGMHPLLGVPLAFVVMALLGGALHGTGIHRWAQSQSKLMISLSVLAGAALLRGVFMEEGVSHLGMNGSQLSQNAGIFLTVLLVINGGIYNLIISRVIERDLFTSLLATFGLAIMMAQLMNLMFGSDTQSIKLEYETLYFFDDFVSIPIAKLIGVVMALSLAAAVIYFMKTSRMGQAIRATAQDARAARVMGIDTEKIYAFTFSLNSAICGAAGAIIVMVWLIQPFYGITYSIRAFVIVTAAGLGNLPGVIAAGLGIGALEQYGSHIFGIGYQQAIAVLLLLLVLFIRLLQQRRSRQALQ
ncbi:MAG: branched-chain amino acid ABC transporter permease [Rhizobiaceae bacterium]|nr:branched-chain amino acid ABC transporter permease [Rhizobiaceae bacterium]